MPKASAISPHGLKLLSICLSLAIPVVFLVSGCEKTENDSSATIEKYKVSCRKGATIPFDDTIKNVDRDLVLCEGYAITWQHLDASGKPSTDFKVDFTGDGDPFSFPQHIKDSSGGAATSSNATLPAGIKIQAYKYAIKIDNSGVENPNVHVIVLGK